MSRFRTRIFVLALLAFVVPSVASAITTQNTTLPQPKNLTQGLVGWWTFDGKDVNWASGRVMDKSGSGNTGYMSGMATKTARWRASWGRG